MLNRGETIVRTVKALAAAGGNAVHAKAYAQGQAWLNAQAVCESLKGAVTSLGTDDADQHTPAAHDLSEFIRPMMIIGKLTGLRKVPSRVRLITATSGSGAYWAGERQPRPISRAAYTGETVEPLGVTAVVVVTKELLMSSAPSAESTLSRDLASANVAAADTAFIDPGNAGATDAKPAAITFGASSRASTGTTLAAIDADLDWLINTLTDAGSDLSFAHFVLLPRTALFLARLRGTGGDAAFPGMTAKGGTLLGIPAITSTNVPGTGSPSASIIALLDASQILLVDDGGGEIEISTQGTIAMADNPSAPASVTSLWQTGSAAIKTTRFMNWRRTRDNMAVYLSGVNY